MDIEINAFANLQINLIVVILYLQYICNHEGVTEMKRLSIDPQIKIAHSVNSDQTIMFPAHVKICITFLDFKNL